MHYRTFSTNPTGRDFLVADLHGAYDLLMKKLSVARFDPSRDRLFSVGDLVDRGAQSLQCLGLLRQPWFHAVRGNHESSLLYAATLGEQAFPGCAQYLATEAKWLTELTDAQTDTLYNELLPLVEGLPLVIHVQDREMPFNVVHAQAASPEGSLMTDAQLLHSDAASCDSVMWGRELYESDDFLQAWHAGFAVDKLFFSPTPFSAGLSPTYVGHSVVGTPFVHLSHIFLDCGGWSGHPKSSLSLLEHRKVARALQQVEQGMRCFEEEGETTA